ncbi:hypothetical protein CL657_04065 [bacterium]|nr:hypothetical protein [bacterium]
MNESDSYGNTVLHWATKVGNSEVVNALIKLKAKVVKTNCCRETPLHLAERMGHTEVVKALIAAEENEAWLLSWRKCIIY